MDENNPIRRFLGAPLTAPLAWLLNIATSALYFRKSAHPALAAAIFGAVILTLLVMLVSAAKRHDRRALQRVTEYTAVCFLIETCFLMMT